MTAPQTSAQLDLAGLALPPELATAPLSRAVAEVGEPSPAPGQAPSGGLESWEVTPGLIGFVPVFLIALACVGLFLSLTRHLRRVTVRQALRDAEDEAAAGTADGGPVTGTTGGTTGGATAHPGHPAPGESPSDRR